MTDQSTPAEALVSFCKDAEFHAVEGESDALRTQAKPQVSFERHPTSSLGTGDDLLRDVPPERNRGTAIPLLEGSANTARARPEPEPPHPSGSNTLIDAATKLMWRLEEEPPAAGLEGEVWEVALACHGRMLAVETRDRTDAIAHALAGAQLIEGLRARGFTPPDWLVEHEEQLCRYGGLWIHGQLLAPMDCAVSDGCQLARRGMALLTRLDQIHGGSHAWIRHHLFDLQAEAFRSAAPRQLAIAMAGNCQYWPLLQYLKPLLPAARLEPGPTVHLATVEEVARFHRRLRDVDVLLVHRIQPGYRNDIGLDNRTLASHLPPESRQLVLPNLHYEGHHPWIGYAHDPEGRLAGIEASSPLGPYHDFLAMQAALHGVPAAEILTYSLSPGLAARIRQNHRDSLEQLRRREADCDVEIASWIDQHHRQTPVAHTCNHPTHAPLHALLLRVLEVLDLGVTLDPSHLDRREYLGGLSIPILPWVRQALALEEWAAGWGSRDGLEPFSIETQLIASIAFYRDHPWIAEQNQVQEKFRWAGSVLAEIRGKH